MQAIQELGDAVARAWLACDYADDAFATIASQALRQSELLRRSSQSQLNEWFLTETRLPEQQFRDFGQPALTLYRGHKFYIELLHWLDSTTAIHQHSFTGAFGVFRGSSLHTRYDFKCDHVISSEFILGDLTFRSSELLTQGDVREIGPGKAFIHSLFHLDRPSITLVVRTHSLTRSYPQYSYRRPGIGYDPFYKPEPFATRLRLLATLRDSSNINFWSLARELLVQCDPWMTFALLSMVHEPEKTPAGWDNLIELARKRHGGLIDIILQSFEEKTREQNITARRRDIWETDHRFFLALLLNLPHRQAIYKLIAQRYPESDPETLILRWLSELAAAGKIGLNFDALSLKMLQHVLNDLSLEDMFKGLAEVFGETQVDEERGNLNRLWNELHESSLLRPLLRRGEPDALRLNVDVAGDGRNGSGTRTSADKKLGSGPIELDVTVSTDELESGKLYEDPVRDVRFEPEAGSLPDVPLKTLPQGEIVLMRDPVRCVWFPNSLSNSQVELVRSKLSEKVSIGAAHALRADEMFVPQHDTSELCTQWSNMLAEARNKLTSHRFALVSSLLPSHLLNAIAAYYRQRVAQGYIRLRPGTTNNYAAHREPLAEWLHPIVGEMLRPAFPVEVKPSYTYLSVYTGGATLERHTDRPQCEFTVSLCVDATPGGERWPLYVESPVDNAVIEVRLPVGDAIIFKGRELPHSRRALALQESVTSLLFHFVETTFQGGLD